jgi:putative OPT family oligopeptide transporter
MSEENITPASSPPDGITEGAKAGPTADGAKPVEKSESTDFKPYVPDSARMHEFTWPAVLVGTILGIIFGASSLYLLLKVGMTVSASVPIAVLSITLFRAFSKSFGFRQATILENNVVQTAGSAGESIAFGVGVTMPALLLLGFEMHWVTVMTVSVLGGLLGILMMIPLRRAFIVKQHGKLKYPEGTACAEVLVAGEKGGTTAKMVFIGFGIAFVYKFLSKAFRLWAAESDDNSTNLYATENGKTVGLKGAAISGDLHPEMLGVGFLIGPRIACMMMAGAVLSFFVLGPMIAAFGENLNVPVAPAKSEMDEKKLPDGSTVQVDKGLIRNMDPDAIYGNYLRFIGAGAVAAGGIISMCRVLPLIVSSVVAGFRDLRGSAAGRATARTERDMSIYVVLFGCLALVIVLAVVPQLGLGFTLEGILGSIMILVFGFLFVTVSSRLTGEVGSSSNPISGMTIATLLLTCLIFLLIGKNAQQQPEVMLTALSIAAVVCIASSNGGTTSQDLKTGFLVGATPKYQQWAILVGTLTSAIVIGGTMLALNKAGTHYSKRGIPQDARLEPNEIPDSAPTQQVGQPYSGTDTATYRAVYVREPRIKDLDPGWYLVDDQGRIAYWIDVPIERKYKVMDNVGGTELEAGEKFKAPQPKLFQIITQGILTRKLEWGLVITGVLIAVAMELMGVSALPVAVGMYLGLGTAVPIFIGGLLRWLADRWRGVSASEAETETSPGVLLSSGYIAGGTLCGLLLGFVFMSMGPAALSLTSVKPENYLESDEAKIAAVIAFAVVGAILLWVGSRKDTAVDDVPAQPPSVEHP